MSEALPQGSSVAENVTSLPIPDQKAEAVNRLRTSEFALLKEASPEVQTAKKITASFFGQKFPLSSLGNEVKTRAHKLLSGKCTDQELVNLSRDLPTVENPRPELFEDVQLSQEQKASFFGHGNLTNIQATENCSHGCENCAVNAQTGSIKVMPLAGAIKIGQELKRYYSEEGKFLDQLDGKTLETTGIYDAKNNPRLKFHNGLVTGVKPKLLLNYYDGDPCTDYSDPLFLHEDGTPANYGDFIEAIGHESRPIFITSAGWSKGNQKAMRTAQKLVDIHSNTPEIIKQVNISVTKYESLAIKDPARYLENLLNTIESLNGITMYLLVYRDKDDTENDQFHQDVVKPLLEHVENMKNMRVVKRKFSYFSGKMEDEEAVDDYDVMYHYIGFHIKPDGKIAFQGAKGSDDKWGLQGIEKSKGSEPILTGQRVFELLSTQP